MNGSYKIDCHAIGNCELQQVERERLDLFAHRIHLHPQPLERTNAENFVTLFLAQWCHPTL
jgi:hypothetical protein